MTAVTRSSYLNFYALIYIALIYAPVLLLPIFSFNDASVAAFPLRDFTVKWYQALIAERSYQSAFLSSLGVASAVAATSTVMGFLAALGLARRELPGRTVIIGVIMLPLLLPPLVVGVSLLTFFRQTLGLELSLVTVALGHVVICMPYSTLVLLARLESFDRSMLEASLDLGQGPLQTLRRITLPLAMPGIVASLLLTSVVSFDEFVVAFFLSGTKATLPIAIWGSLRFPAKLPVTLALGSLILIATATIIFAADLYRRQSGSSASSDNES